MNRGPMINVLLGLGVALLPFYTRVSFVDVSRSSKDILSIIIMGLVLFLLGSKKREAPLCLKWAAFLVFIGVTFNQVQDLQIPQNYTERLMLLVNMSGVVIRSFYLMIGAVFTVSLYERLDKNSANYVLNGFAVGCILQATHAVLSFHGFDFYTAIMKVLYPGMTYKVYTPQSSIGAIGTLGNPNLLAAYLSITMPALFRGRFLVFLPVALYALILTKSDMGAASFFAGLMAFLFWGKIKNTIHKAVLYVPLFYFAFISFFANGKDSGRFEIISKIIKKMSFSDFVLGGGVGWFQKQYIILGGARVMQEHNELIAALGLFGIFGAALYLIVIKEGLKKSHCKIFAAILLAAFVNSMGHFTLHASTTALCFLIALVFCMAGGKNGGNLEW